MTDDEQVIPDESEVEGLDRADDGPEVVEAEVEVVDDDAPEEPEDLPVAEFGDSTELATYSVNFGGFSFRLLPQSTSSGVDWRIWVFANNVQGPILRTNTAISQAEAEDLGIPESLRNRINEGLEFAQNELDLPPALKRETEDRSLEDLEAMMGGRG